MGHEKIVDKIRKLLALAEKAGTEEEALAATQKAHELLSLYNISLADVSIRTLGDEDLYQVDRDFFDERYNEYWRNLLMKSAANLHFCRYYYTKLSIPGKKTGRFQLGVRHYVVGREANRRVGILTGRYLVDTVNRLANDGWKNYRSYETGSTARGRYVRSFRLAASGRLKERLDALRLESERGETVTSDGRNLPALATLYQREQALVNRYFEKNNIAVVRRQRNLKVTNQDGFFDGRAAADTVNLNPQIGATSRKMIR